MKRVVCAFMLLAGMTIFAACGSSGGVDSSLDAAPAAVPAPAPQLLNGLPDSSELTDEAARSASIAGPGWYTLDLAYRSFGSSESGVAEDASALDISGAGSVAYCVLGVHGFDGDSYPTGLRADVSDVSGEYFLAHTNFLTGRWETAGPFTESTMHEYPEVSEASDPQLLTSGYSNHFVAIIVPDGSSLQLDLLQLGVHGGSEGPEPIIQMTNKSNEDQATITWVHSTSYNDPDFAGYSVERTTFPPTSYTLLTDENIMESHFTDDTAELNKTYLYRVTVWDTAGNSAPAFGYPAGRIAGTMATPVCVVDMPRGPLVGPVEVTIDLSDSFDNDGDAFTEYLVDFGLGIGEISGLDPVFTQVLQPGCYSLRMRVAAGGNSDTKYQQLKVYPQWQDSSQLIDAGTPLVYRNFAPRAFYDHVSGKSVFLFSDSAVPSLVSLTIDSEGNTDRFDAVHPFEDGMLLVSEPQFVNGAWIFSTANENQVFTCSWQDNEILPYFGAGTSVDSAFTALVANDDNERWVIYHEQDGGYDLIIFNMNTFQEVKLVDDLAIAAFLDAEWNEDAGAIDILYSGNGKVQWMRWSPVIGVLDTADVGPADSQFVDIEIDPATGRPAALMHDGVSVLFSELQDDDTTWSVAGKVDPDDADWPQTGLIYRDGTAWCYIGDNPGGSTLYRKDGANWTPVNDADYADGGIFTAMTYIPDVEGFHVLDVAFDWATRVTLMQDDGSEEELWINEGWARNALELSAASSGTQIHLLHKPVDNYLHWVSADGETWTETNDAGLGAGGRIAADASGEIYASLINGGNVYLRHWVDPAWVDVQDFPVSNNTLPLIYGQGNGLAFGAFDGNAVPDEFNFKRNLDAPIVFLPQTTAIWDGTMAGQNANDVKFLVRYDGFNFDDGNVGIMNTSGEIQFLFEPSFGFYDDPWAVSRHMEGAFFRNDFQSPREVFYVAYGGDAGLARVYRNPSEDWVVDSFPVIFPEIDATDYRRTVTATTAWGDCSVGMANTLIGKPLFFEWSNFGDFEALPVPEALENASHHELVVGPDGRWHIIYRDYVNDDLRILSTV